MTIDRTEGLKENVTIRCLWEERGGGGGDIEKGKGEGGRGGREGSEGGREGGRERDRERERESTVYNVHVHVYIGHRYLTDTKNDRTRDPSLTQLFWRMPLYRKHIHESGVYNLQSVIINR